MCPDKMPAAQPGALCAYREMSALTLAFIGDAVYELLVRRHILSLGEGRVGELHRKKVELANAGFQSGAMDGLLPLLSDEEQSVYRRGRNAHPGHTPKNKSEAEYHRATGFEALFGYLYLAGRSERVEELFSLALELSEKKETEAALR